MKDKTCSETGGAPSGKRDFRQARRFGGNQIAVEFNHERRHSRADRYAAFDAASHCSLLVRA